ncbi:MAG: ankyrin repeat domain-containing protein [Granulosicoccus sp.]
MILTLNFKLSDLCSKYLPTVLLASLSLPCHPAAIHDAVKVGNLDEVVALLDAGADINESDYFVGGPLFIAAGRPDTEVVRVLLERGADPDLVGESGDNTPLHQAAIAGINDNIELLIKASANMENLNARGDSALHLASADGNLSAMKLLMNAGADIDAVNDVNQTTPIQAATLNGQIEAVRYLVTNGAGLDVKDAQGRGLLHNAAVSYSYTAVGDASLVTYLFENGAPYVNEALEWALEHKGHTADDSTLIIEELKRLSKL